MTKKDLTDEEFVNQFKIKDTKPAKTAIHPTLRQEKGYVPSFPLRLIRAVVEAKAEKALPLVLAIHRQMVMTRQRSIPLSGAVWDAAGSPNRRERDTVLRNLRKLRKIYRLTVNKTMFSHYLVSQGPLWAKEDPK